MLKKRNADLSRLDLLETAGHEIHQYGYHAASISRILENTSLTRGALYHHFPSKQALGYAVIDELFANYMKHLWYDPLADYNDPIQAIEQAIANTYQNHGNELISFGCPLNNLSQEMSAVDEGFRERINRQYDIWQTALSDALIRGQQNRLIRKDIDTTEAAIFIVAAIEGCIGLAKNHKSEQTLHCCTRGLIDYLYGLRVTQTGQGEG